MSDRKKIIGVLRGGPSSEYEISLQSGECVLKNLPREQFEPRDIFISKNGEWHDRGVACPPAKILENIDAVWNALHGEYGEDGKVQAILESHGIPFTGPDKLGAAVAMNKKLTKERLAGMNIKLPLHLEVVRDENPVQKATEAFLKFPPPYVVKPTALGSSVGVLIVRTAADLPSAISDILSISPSVLIEEFVGGREATAGVVQGLRGENIYALPPIEIRPAAGHEFFDYQAKYGGGSEEICPGNFSRDEKDFLEQAAVEIHRALGLRHYSRSDFIVSPRGIYFLEVNTLPGFTAESLIPRALAAVGVSIPEFLEHVLGLALERR